MACDTDAGDSGFACCSVESESGSGVRVLVQVTNDCVVGRETICSAASALQRNGLPSTREDLALGLRSAPAGVVGDESVCPDCQARRLDKRMKLVLALSGEWIAPMDLAKNKDGGLVPVASWDVRSLLANEHWVRVLKDPEDGEERLKGVHYEEMNLWKPKQIISGCCPRCPDQGFSAFPHECFIHGGCQVKLLATSPDISRSSEIVAHRPLLPPDTIRTPSTPTTLPPRAAPAVRAATPGHRGTRKSTWFRLV